MPRAPGRSPRRQARTPPRWRRSRPREEIANELLPCGSVTPIVLVPVAVPNQVGNGCACHNGTAVRCDGGRHDARPTFCRRRCVLWISRVDADPGIYLVAVLPRSLPALSLRQHAASGCRQIESRRPDGRVGLYSIVSLLVYVGMKSPSSGEYNARGEILAREPKKIQY